MELSIVSAQYFFEPKINFKSLLKNKIKKQKREKGSWKKQEKEKLKRDVLKI